MLWYLRLHCECRVAQTLTSQLLTIVSQCNSRHCDLPPRRESQSALTVADTRGAGARKDA